MRNSIFWLVVVSLTVVLAPGALAAGVGLDVYSQHMWRGASLADEVTVQPSAWVPLGAPGLSLGVWGSFAAQNRTAYDQADRLDFIVDFQKSPGPASPLTFRAGFREYTFPNGPDGSKHTEEAYAGVKASLPLVNAELTLYRDFNVIEGTYVQAGFSPPVSPVPGLDLRLDVGVSDYSDEWKWNDVTTSLRLGIPLGPLVEAGPAVGYTYSNGDLYEDNSNFWAGVSVRLFPQ